MALLRKVYAEVRLEEYQTWLRGGKSTMNHIFMLRELMEKYCKYKIWI